LNLSIEQLKTFFLFLYFLGYFVVFYFIICLEMLFSLQTFKFLEMFEIGKIFLDFVFLIFLGLIFLQFN